MRILVVTRSLPFHGLGGMEVVAWDLARALSRLGAKVTILTTACPSLPEYIDLEGVHIHCLNAPSGRYSATWWQLSKDAYLSSYEANVDVVLSVSAGAMSMAQDRKQGALPVFIAQAHGTAWGEFVSKIKERTPTAILKSLMNLKAMADDRGYRRFDAFVAVGEIVRDGLTRHPTRWIIGRTKPVHLIANGIDADAFAFSSEARQKTRQELGISEEASVVISASRLHPQKGLMEGIEAFSQANKQNQSLRYVIVGSGQDEARLREAVRRKGLCKVVKFVGHMPRDRIRDHLSAADIFLFSTKRVEGLPMNVLEALASGLPIIASRHVVDPSFNAVSIDPNNSKEIADAILSATAIPLDRSSRLPKGFTLDQSAVSYMDVFNESISGSAT